MASETRKELEVEELVGATEVEVCLLSLCSGLNMRGIIALGEPESEIIRLTR